MKYLFEQRNPNGKLSQYAMCPSCLNPIQLIGVSHEWNQTKYEYCLYASHKEYILPNDTESLDETDLSVIELYNLLRDSFDKVVYIIQRELHIRCSTKFWTDALHSYLINKVYCYPWLSEANLPYIFAYRGMQHMKCFGQQFEEDSDLYTALSNLQSVVLEKNDENSRYGILKNREGHFVNLIFRFTKHRQNAVEGEKLNETMLFCIDDANSGQVIYERKISFDETFFMNVINSEKAALNQNQELLKKAAEMMPSLM